MRNQTGSSIIEYSIIIVTIAVALGAVFSMLGNSVNTNLELYASSYADINSNVSQTIDLNQQSALNSNSLVNNTTPSIGGSLGGTPQAPVSQCSGGSCTIDYGTYALTGIPENFSTFVETSGIAGGTTKLSSLMAQIATSLEESGQPEQAEKIQKLADISYTMAALENVLEKTVVKCNGNQTCLQNELSKPYSLSTTDYPYFHNNATLSTINNIKNEINIGNHTYNKLNEPDAYSSNSLDGRVAVLAIEQYDLIMNDTNIDNDTKAIITELYRSVGVIGEEVNLIYDLVYGMGSSDSYHDPLTGEITEYTDTILVGGIDDLREYVASNLTNLNSSLMCATTAGTTTGTQCN